MATAPGLCDQLVVQASAEAKIKLSILATALVDALGGPPEFHARFTFPLVTSFGPNTNFGTVLEPGTWTDDSSMTLSLARSIATYGFDEARQLEAYANWYQKGELSAVGECFDIGNTIRTALDIYIANRKSPQTALKRIQGTLSSSSNAGNGSLMRVLPVGLAYWRDPVTARAYARRSSQTTHPTLLCLEACEVWTGAIATVMQQAVSVEGKGTTAPSTYSKLDLLQYISDFPYQTESLRQFLTIPIDAPSFSPDEGGSVDIARQREAYYKQYHPILRLIETVKTRPPGFKGVSQNIDIDFPFVIPPADVLPSTGYVLHSLVAALHCFFATDTFEAGAIMAVNLGNDADTVGAIYAGLAGCWYASLEEGESSNTSVARHLFWSKKVLEWKAGLLRRELVEEVAEELVRYERSL